MKHLRKIFALLVSALMILAMAGTAFAANEETGSIEVENVISGQAYSIYRILDLESYDTDAKAFSYSLNSDWKAFVNQSTIKGVYLDLEESGGTTYAKWVDGADAPTFAALAIKWAKDNNVAAVQTKTAGDTLEFENLPLGYYLLDSAVGALCSLTTNAPNATVKEKNELTTVEKKVQEDSTQEYGKNNNAQIGETVNFMSEIKVGSGVQNLVLHDAMDETLDLIANSFDLSIDGKTIAAEYYTVLTENVDDGDTFDIVFDNDYAKTLSSGQIICVKYSAVLNQKAKIYTNSNDNTTWVTFGDNLKSTNSTTKTYAYEFDLVKTDASGKVIKGAEFYLYDAKTNGNIIPVVELSADDENGVYVYRLADKGEVSGNGAVIKAGKTTIRGLDAESYYLQEENAPKGFNKLSERVTVDLTKAENNKATISNDGSALGSYKEGGVQVINKAGTILPETGGMGTTILYIIGGVIVMGAVIALVVRKKSRS